MVQKLQPLSLDSKRGDKAHHARAFALLHDAILKYLQVKLCSLNCIQLLAVKALFRKIVYCRAAYQYWQRDINNLFFLPEIRRIDLTYKYTRVLFFVMYNISNSLGIIRKKLQKS